jgi:hypothetical protein
MNIYLKRITTVRYGWPEISTILNATPNRLCIKLDRLVENPLAVLGCHRLNHVQIFRTQRFVSI